MNLFDIAAKISLDSSGFEKGISSAVSLGKKAATAITGTVDKITSIGETAAKIVSGVSVSVAGGVAALTKNAVDEFAEYEQLVGGVETLFKDSADIVARYASGAYKSAGLDANAYMETVTSFSASLLQSLSGDTEAAAEKANMALTDMSDNANKMGSSMEMIQNAYAGFAKQNYTMLDNLKLGYGGTKTEMERLLKDAQKISGIKYNISSYADIIDAIHVIQTEMGITGTTALEAEKTISGSTAAMRAAWKNLLIGLSDDTQDMDVLVDNFVQSAIIAADNILPRVKITLSTVANLAEKYSDEAGGFVADMLVSAGETAPELIGRITNLIVTLISEIQKHKDELRTGATNVFEALLDGFEQTLDAALPLAGEFVPDFVKMFLKYKTTMFKAGVQIIVELAKGLSGDSDELADAAVDAVEAITGVIADNIDIVLDAGYNIIESLANALLEDNPELESNSGEIIRKIVAFAEARFPDILALALALLRELATGLADSKNLETLVPAVLSMIGKLVLELTKPENLTGLVGAALDILKTLGSGLINSDNLEALLENAPTIIENLATGLSDSVTKIRSGVDAIVKEIGDYLKNDENKKKLIKAGGEISAALIEGIAMIFASLTGMGEESAERLVNGVKKVFSDDWGIGLLEVGSGLLEGGFDIVADKGKEVIDGLKGTVDSAIDTWNNAFGDFGTGALKIEGAPPPLMEPSEPTLAETISDDISEIVIENDVGSGVSQNIFDEIFKTASAFFESIAAVEGSIDKGTFDALEKILGANIEKIIINSGKYDGSVGEAKETAANVSQKIADYLQNAILELPKEGATGETTNNTTLNITQNIYSLAQTAADLMQEAAYEAERRVAEGVQE